MLNKEWTTTVPLAAFWINWTNWVKIQNRISNQFLFNDFILKIFYSFVGMYFTLPETEGKSLDDIENYFSDRKRKLTDIYIPSNLL